MMQSNVAIFRWIFCLASLLIGLSQAQITSYTVGTSLNLTYDKSMFVNETVVLVLDYFNGIKSATWTVGTFPNTGLITTTPNLTDTTEQLKIPNNATGRFVVVDPANDVVENVTSQIPIYQPLFIPVSNVKSFTAEAGSVFTVVVEIQADIIRKFRTKTWTAQIITVQDQKWENKETTEANATEITWSPTHMPTSRPTQAPTSKPTAAPTAKPTEAPTQHPTPKPTLAPTVPTVEPTLSPTMPTVEPTSSPTKKPTNSPTQQPTMKPTMKPTAKPTMKPTAKPTMKPTAKPTMKPTATPTMKPTAKPTTKPTATPTMKPSARPTANPTTASPTTASPTTASPTTASPTTASPTTASPTTASPTTASPTTASPTTASPTTPSPTTPSPTTPSPTTPTFDPTQKPTTPSPTTPTFDPTQKPTTRSPTTPSPTTPSPTTPSPTTPTFDPTQKPTTPSPVLSPTMPTFDPTQKPTLRSPRRLLAVQSSTELYEVDVVIPENGPALGQYGLLVGISGEFVDTTTTNMTFYTVLGAPALDSPVLVYNSSTLSVTLDSIIVTTDRVPLTVSVGTQDIPLVVALKQNGAVLPVGCNPPYRASDYNTFGWFSPNETFSTGEYTVGLYWYPSNVTTADLSKYELTGTFPTVEIVEPSEVNMSDINTDPFVVHGSSNTQPVLTSGSVTTINLTTSFNTSTKLTYQIFQKDGDATNTITSEQTFTYDSTKSSNELSINVPSELSDDSSLQTYIHFIAYGCSGDTIATDVQFTTKSSGSSSDNTIGTGAIVGIVCACVLIVGIGTWWVCMKRRHASAESAYSAIEEEK